MRVAIASVAVLLLAIPCLATDSTLPKVTGYAAAPVRERLDRGLIARPEGEGKVYLGWRLLDSDSPDVAFNVYRRSGAAAPVKVNAQPIRQTTDLVDAAAPNRGECVYCVRAVAAGKEGPASEEVRVVPAEKPSPFRSIRLNDVQSFQKAGIADLDGDGRYDFVLKHPGANIDPWYKYWKPSPDTYKLDAYRHDGKFLWRFDLGWSIERGIWYSPYVVYDLDGDGRAEVAVKTGQGDPRDPDGKVTKGPEYLTILDGLTGKPIAQVDWPSREGFDGQHGYNYASRNQLGVAYLDGKTPSLIVERGTYNRIKVVAYEFHGRKLRELWRWDNKNESKKYWGQGAHWMHGADLDGDGRDEVLLGSFALDDNGASLWTTGLGHPDHLYVGDLDPSHAGLEIYYGIERSNPRNGMCMVDAHTGQILWGHDQKTTHIHSSGLASDIDAAHPGAECYSGERDFNDKRWLRDCKGNVLSTDDMGGLAPRAVYWNADLQRELLRGSRISVYRGPDLSPRVEGQIVAIADILGDWREEIIASAPGEMRIYTTAIPAADRRVTLMQDRLYRLDVVVAAMGYFQPPLTSYDLATKAAAKK